MGTRTSIRPRPLDPNRQISIVRDLDELDNSDLLQAADVAEVQPAQPKQKHRDIPTPAVRPVPTYKRDYLPTFHIPGTYIRGRGGTGWQKECYVEYDLDNEDEDWLRVFNNSQNRLSDETLETMLWRLELSCADANERAHTTVDRPPDKMTPQQINSTDNLSRDSALQLLRELGVREPVVLAVHQYWLQKRKKWGKPILRRLQAPTSASDTNPFNVFRPREKVNRPQTRRRRENNEECLEKMRMIRQNLSKAVDIVGDIIQREHKKRDLVYVECAMQQLAMRLRHEGKGGQEAAEAEVLAELQQRMQRNAEAYKLKTRLVGPNGSTLTPADSVGSLRRPTQPTPKRRKSNVEQEPKPRRDAVKQLGPPPPPMDLDMDFTRELDLDSLLQVLDGFQIPADILSEPQSCRVRFGRGGRLVIDRCDPLSYEPIHTPPAGPPPTHADPTTSEAKQQAVTSTSGRPSDGTGTSTPGPSHHPADKPPGRPPDPNRQQGGAGGGASAAAPAPRGSGGRGRGGGNTPAKRGPGRPPKATKAGANGEVGGHYMDGF